MAGDTTSALDWVSRAVRLGDERIGWFRKNPRLVGIQDDPRFQRITAAIESRKQREGQ